MQETLKSSLESRKDISTIQQLYNLQNGLEIVIFDEILVKFKSNVGKQQQDEINDKFKTSVIENCEIFQILRVSKGDDALEVANKFYETGLVEFSKPNFLSNFKPFQVIPNDPYFGNQITCHNVGQTFNDGHSGTIDADIDAPEAWEITTGSNNIIIAVIDQGVISNHPDLPNTRQVRLAGSDRVDGDADPSPVGNNNHGNACAGVIGATMNNNEGIAGIAPNCRIMPIRIDYNTSSSSDFANAIRFAVDNGADVISNSWGLGDYSQPPYSPNLYPEVVSAIQYAVNSGCGNKGCIVLFAVGNNADHTINSNGYISFPANVTVSGVLSVGASDRNDNQANYSPTSDPNHAYNQIIDIVAPSHRAYPCQIAGETFEMWSIDIPNTNGYNPWNISDWCMNPPAVGSELPTSGTNYLSYTGRFGGTSHSCPVVAGVAALVLSVNPDLTYLQVSNIILSTADQVGGYTYTNDRCNELGYGRVNACRAVSEAYRLLLSVSGSYTLFCSPTAYTANNVRTVSTISWNCSDNISKISIPGSNPFYFQANGNDPGWIEATILTECGNIIIPRKDVWVGKFENTWVTGQAAVCPGNLYTYTAQVPGGHSPSYTYYWTYPSNWIFYSQYDNVIRLQTPMYNPQYGAVRVSINNPCGTSGYSGITVYPSSGCGGYFTIYPNPASDNVTVEINNNSPVSITDDPSMAYLENYLANYIISIYNRQGTLLYTKTNASKKTNIPLNNFNDGSYIIEINDDKNRYTQQLIVKHE